jgi:thiamine-monophosphate kinase
VPNDPRGHTPIGPGAEFDLVRRMEVRWGPRAQGIGDDAAVLRVPDGHQLVVSTDVAVDQVHFRRDWLTPEEIGFRATASALSDLAAMGAEPLGVVCALVLPKSWLEELDLLAEGIGAAAAGNRTPIVGGDISHGDALTIAVTVFGHARRVIPRSGAQSGDALFLTGSVGLAGAALRAFSRGETPPPGQLARFSHPQPRIREGVWLAEHGATAMIDVSDGIASEARHLAAASEKEIRIALDSLPLPSGVSPRDAALSGEEYELLVTASETLPIGEFTQMFNIPLTRIGAVISSPTPKAAFTLRGTLVDLAQGYDHFSQ